MTRERAGRGHAAAASRKGHLRACRYPADCAVAGIALRRGLDMVHRFSCRDSAVVTGRAGSYYSRMINLGYRVPCYGRMAGITACGAGYVRRRFAGGCRAVVTGITVSRYTRMIKLNYRLPRAG